jgi:hypothetical protein
MAGFHPQLRTTARCIGLDQPFEAVHPRGPVACPPFARRASTSGWQRWSIGGRPWPLLLSVIDSGGDRVWYLIACGDDAAVTVIVRLGVAPVTLKDG